MEVTSAHVRSQLANMISLRSQFVELSNATDAKLTTIINSAKSFQDRMGPLNQDMEQLRTRIKNIEYCTSSLQMIHTYFKCGRGVEKVIYEGPSEHLEEYLKAMDEIRIALKYFRENHEDHVELSRLQALYKAGTNALDKEYEAILQRTFPPIDPDKVFEAIDNDDAASNLNKASEMNSSSSVTRQEAERFDALEAGDLMHTADTEIFRRLASWMTNTAENGQLLVMVPSPSFRAGYVLDGGGAESSPSLLTGKNKQAGQDSQSGSLSVCLSRYCAFRRDHLADALKACKNSDSIKDTAIRAQKMSASGKGRRRRIGKKAQKELKEKQRTGDGGNEAEEENAEQYALSVSAMVLLMQNERHLLKKLQMTSNAQEMRLALEVIFKTATSHFLAEGSAISRTAALALRKGNFHQVLPLFEILRRFSMVSTDLCELLRYHDSLQASFQGLVTNLQTQCMAALTEYLDKIRSVDKQTAGMLVPEDGTVHELATNTIMYGETLLEHADVIGVVFSWADAIQSGTNMSTSSSSEAPPSGVGGTTPLAFLASGMSAPEQTKKRLGCYLLQLIVALIGKLDKRSESYTEEILRLVFQMNNLQYILKNIRSSHMDVYINEFDSEAIGKIAKVLAERKVVYIKVVAKVLALYTGMEIVDRFAQSRQLDTKEKSAVKGVWTTLNDGINLLRKQHGSAHLADAHLTEDLTNLLRREIIPQYTELLQRSMAIPFTEKREKYIRYSVLEFQAAIEELLRN